MKFLQASALVVAILTCVYIAVTWTWAHPYISHSAPVQAAKSISPQATQSSPPKPAPQHAAQPTIPLHTASITPAPEPSPAPTPDPAPAPPETHTKTFSLMPGQYINIPNRKFKKVEIHSEYPMRVATGPCHLDYGVQFYCPNGPADIFISDMRRKPIFATPRGNEITITVTEY